MDEGFWHNESIDLVVAGYESTDLKIRFRCQASSIYEDANVDNVRIEAIGGGPANQAPIANDDPNAVVNEDETLVVSAPGVLLNDTDPEFDTLTAVLVTDVSNGTLTLNSDGSFNYTPANNYFGSDNFSYLANDGVDDSNIATATITINSINDAPIATGESYSLSVGNIFSLPTPGILSNDTDVENDSLNAILNTDVSNGTLTLNSDGSFSYEPDNGFSGTDSFTYLVQDDGGLDSNVVTVTLTVTEVNNPPVVIDESYSVNEDEILSRVAVEGILKNATDGESDALTAMLNSNVSNGTLNLNTDGSFNYQPANNFFGSDSFTYYANDGSDDSNIATVTITINPINDAPVANGESYNLNAGSIFSLPTPGILSNDTDAENDSLNAILNTDVSNGTLTLNSDGSFSYEP
ncbi:MAG: tandem-95 repeat protein, partial [Planctomycetaceae bacterium]|nr:tandem-95 repeat protein [Planctomycetaceae bacterium]